MAIASRAAISRRSFGMPRMRLLYFVRALRRRFRNLAQRPPDQFFISRLELQSKKSLTLLICSRTRTAPGEGARSRTHLLRSYMARCNADKRNAAGAEFFSPK